MANKITENTTIFEAIQINPKAGEIELKDVPADMEVELVTKSLAVTVRGENIDLMDFKPENIVVSVSAANLQPGSVSAVDAVVQIKGSTSITAVGTYPIKVSVMAAD